ncbi:dTDP-4-dehydrorhamnose reductase [Erwinia aphidicola]|uniref:dTDP-4-dehydrorhamnose reductase n=1 Tax=Erwinia aphidicola TaxID=68334 RepID=UPI001D26DB75|nr:dTDP-4-dehydrorhamnose reductase [Erwinia aphidicola]CAH0230866.1 dTDP-4-dehydrorhamnose reductase [Erwinia aphidicola]
MNILLFGKNGQVGWELQRSLATLGNVTALATSSTDYCGDFTNTAGIIATIRALRPDVIVNAAAYTAVDAAESEPEQANRVNAETVAAIACEAESLGAWLVHYSTDYVFDGYGEQAWREEDTPQPLNTYGRTKLAGERAIQQACSKYLIFRTSWVYATRGNNFAKTMLRLAKEREELGVINDQFGAPTGADLLADCTAHALKSVFQQTEAAGIYHLVASGTTTWYDYAQLVFDEARRAGLVLKLKQVRPLPTSSYPTPAMRPLNSRLDNRKFQRVFQLNLPGWQAGVQRMLSELAALRAL